MSRRAELEQHSKDELIDIILELRAQNERLERRVAELEAQVNQPRQQERAELLAAPVAGREAEQAAERQFRQDGQGWPGSGAVPGAEPGPHGNGAGQQLPGLRWARWSREPNPQAQL